MTEDLPHEFVQSFLSQLSRVYVESRAKAESDFQEPEMQYMLPHIRRAFSEQLFRETALNAGLAATVEPNRSGNHTYTLVCTGRLSLTISHVLYTSNVPRPAKFREQYSEINQHLRQRSLFEPINNASPQSGDVYGILLHHLDEKKGEDGEILYEDGFVEIGFPKVGCETWLAETVNLYKVRDMQALHLHNMEDIQKQIQKPKPTLKKRRNVVGDETA